MKRKYYLRGLGTGILVTALIMVIASGQKDTMTDEEVRARAKELGMVESTLLSELANQSQPETPPAEEQKPEPEPQPETPLAEEQKPEPEPQPETPPAEEQKPEPEPEREPEFQTSVTIEIRSGESSVTVSRSLAEAGLVDSADSYDSYLCRNGYDKKIRAGVYEIPAGATDEEIAKIITRR